MKKVHVSVALIRAYEIWECLVPENADEDWVWEHFNTLNMALDPASDSPSKRRIEAAANGEEIEEIDMTASLL